MQNKGNFKNRFESKEFFTFRRRSVWIPCGNCDGGQHKVVAEGREFWYDCDECSKDVKAYTIKTTKLSKIEDVWVYLWWNLSSWVIDYDMMYFEEKQEAIDHLTKNSKIVVENINGIYVKVN
jgi:hypothetical protein